MPELSPSKLIIPVNGQEFEFTANETHKIGDFQKMVLENTDKTIKDFKLFPVDGKAEENISIG